MGWGWPLLWLLNSTSTWALLDKKIMCLHQPKVLAGLLAIQVISSWLEITRTYRGYNPVYNWLWGPPCRWFQTYIEMKWHVLKLLINGSFHVLVYGRFCCVCSLVWGGCNWSLRMHIPSRTAKTELSKRCPEILKLYWLVHGNLSRIRIWRTRRDKRPARTNTHKHHIHINIRTYK